jgi:hypothetical protein
MKYKVDVEFGEEYEDKITGFRGFCTGVSHFISGCDQVLLVPAVDEKGSYKEGIWLDDERLLHEGIPVERSSRKGGPCSTPSKN